MKDRSLRSIKPLYKDVIIIGNGPSGLALSYVLSGNAPYYIGSDEHPDPMLLARLSSVSLTESLLDDEKLQFLAQGMEYSGGSRLGTLFDELLHPGIDQGFYLDPLVEWRTDKPPVDHLVIGDGPPGGIWSRLDPDILTLSLSSWMELPGLRFSPDPPKRVRAREVAKYYSRYVQLNGLEKYQLQGNVISVCKCGENTDRGARWEVFVVDRNGNEMIYRARYCVLATGLNQAKRLEVPGEKECNVVHDVMSLDVQLNRLKGDSRPVLVVGAGLSAADAVLLARFRGYSVVHSFRSESVTLGHSLPELMYPEYHKVRQMMQNSSGYPGYTSYPGSTVLSFHPTRTVLQVGNKEETVEPSVSAVLIGSKPNLEFLTDFNCGRSLAIKKEEDVEPKRNPIDVHPFTYEVHGVEGLYALGNLAGDVYVRYITGGAVGAGASILSQIGAH